MSALSQQTNIGAHVLVVPATTSLSLAQTSAAAVTTQDGLTIDRNESGRRRYYSCEVGVIGSFVAASSGRTATLAVNCQHSSDGTSWDTLTTGVAATFGSTNGTTHYQQASTNVNLNGARRYIRVQLPAPTYSDCSSGQGVFSITGYVAFGGADELPAQ